MKALPSIAFNDFSGTAKDVTARHFRGRTVLTVRPFPSKVVSSSQKTNRNAMSKISRAQKYRPATERTLTCDMGNKFRKHTDKYHVKRWATPFLAYFL